WPDESVDVSPLDEVTELPRRPVTRNAWLGPATLIRETINNTNRMISRTMPPTAIRIEDMISSSYSMDGSRGAANGGSSRGAVDTTSTEVGVGASMTYTGVPAGRVSADLA